MSFQLFQSQIYTFPGYLNHFFFKTKWQISDQFWIFVSSLSAYMTCIEEKVQ